MRESDFESGVERYFFQYNGYLFDSETFDRVDGVGARLYNHLQPIMLGRDA